MCKHEWSRRESFIFFLVAVLVYVYPLILADYFYVEDSFRAASGYASWRAEGRFLIDGFYHLLSLSNGTPDSFPLGLLVAGLFMAKALEKLAFHYFSQVNVCSSAVVLPMFFSPLFLSDLVYKYDGPVMTVGLAMIVFAITLKSERKWVEWWGASLLVGCALCVYQPLINAFFGLCCIELYRAINDQKATREWVMLGVEKAAQAGVAALFYLFAIVPFMGKERQRLLALDENWPIVIFQRLESAEERIRPLYTGGHAGFFAVMAILFGLGYAWAWCSGMRERPGWVSKVLMSVAYVSIVPLMIISVPGIMLVFFYENNDSRAMLGAGPLLVFIVLVIYQWLSAVQRKLTVLVVLPVILMVSVSYSYGRVLSLKRTLETDLMSSLAYSISANATLASVKVFYFNASAQDFWLPASAGTVSIMPVMPYLVGADFLFLPEAMARVGITNVVQASHEHSADVRLKRDARPIVDNLFYSIYLEDGDGYIVMKQQPRVNP
ncbi:glucosyltransferase domain-containing protein [Pseudomonas sp. MIACH]|uniref:glucosyltransferase domain-containing protein n=1 Tax=Pseudomonas sp. MIACH TaxID=1078355 RepID=UPI00069F2975|nr:glucosyltransferase domain-containing protein [Pseudomonas sp. MIACH]